MTRELSTDQKAIVRLHVIRETVDGPVKCCYCEKEISSRNVDRWASHLRGCARTPEDVKALIQPLRAPGSPVAAVTTASVAAAATAAAVAAATVSSAAVAAQSTTPQQPVPPTPSQNHVAVAPTAAPTELKLSPFAAQALAAAPSYNEVFKVHVSKDYMKFNAAHFIAYKVRAAAATAAAS